MMPKTDSEIYDITIVGAGPVGLYGLYEYLQ